jgi:Clp protease
MPRTSPNKPICLLAKIDQRIAETYASRTKGDIETIRQQMADETWFSAEQAVEQGFADRIGQEHAIAACIRPDVFKYKNVPPQFVFRGEPEPEAPFHEILRDRLAQFERTTPISRSVRKIGRLGLR